MSVDKWPRSSQFVSAVTQIAKIFPCCSKKTWLPDLISTVYTCTTYGGENLANVKI